MANPRTSYAISPDEEDLYPRADVQPQDEYFKPRAYELELASASESPIDDTALRSPTLDESPAERSAAYSQMDRQERLLKEAKALREAEDASDWNYKIGGLGHALSTAFSGLTRSKSGSDPKFWQGFQEQATSEPFERYARQREQAEKDAEQNPESPQNRQLQKLAMSRAARRGDDPSLYANMTMRDYKNFGSIEEAMDAFAALGAKQKQAQEASAAEQAARESTATRKEDFEREKLGMQHENRLGEIQAAAKYRKASGERSGNPQNLQQMAAAITDSPEEQAMLMANPKQLRDATTKRIVQGDGLTPAEQNSINTASTAMKNSGIASLDYYFQQVNQKIKALGGPEALTASSRLLSKNLLGQAYLDKSNPAVADLLSTIDGIKNIVLKERSGAAVTAQEYARFLRELNEGAFRDPKLLMSALGRMRNALQQDSKVILGRLSPKSLATFSTQSGVELPEYQQKIVDDYLAKKESSEGGTAAFKAPSASPESPVAAPAQARKIAVNPQTGERVEWDGKKWVKLP